MGVLHYVNTSDEVQWLVTHNKHKPYVVLMSPDTFNRHANFHKSNENPHSVWRPQEIPHKTAAICLCS